MEMTNNNERIVEKKIYEDGKKEYASKGVAGTALGLGIAGTALGLLAGGIGGGRGVFGSLGTGNMPDNVNINAYGGLSSVNASPSAYDVMQKECADEVKLLTDMFGLKLDTANKFYAMRETDIAEKFSLYKGYVEGLNAENRRSVAAEFGLYKNQRDAYDALNEKYSAKFNELDKKVAIMEATRPYQDKLLMQAIDAMGERNMCYTDRKTCRCIYGVVGLPSTPTVTVLEGANPFGCNCRQAQTPAAGA